MAYQAMVVRVLVASPSDVAAERQVVRDVLYEWNAVHSAGTATVLLPASWETHSAPLLGERAQAVINEQVADGCDLLIGMFWTRLGTPTGEAESGSVEEIRRHLKAGRPAMLYFSNMPVRLDSVDEEQYRKLREFHKEMMAAGLVEEYDSISEFREKLVRQLAITVQDHFQPGTLTVLPAQSAKDVAPLSSEARTLLLAAVQDPQGTILQLGTLAGTVIQTNDNVLVSEPDARTEATWKAAIRELCDRKLIEGVDHNGEVFQVTHGGYEYADHLRTEVER